MNLNFLKYSKSTNLVSLVGIKSYQRVLRASYLRAMGDNVVLILVFQKNSFEKVTYKDLISSKTKTVKIAKSLFSLCGSGSLGLSGLGFGAVLFKQGIKKPLIRDEEITTDAHLTNVVIRAERKALTSLGIQTRTGTLWLECLCVISGTKMTFYKITTRGDTFETVLKVDLVKCTSSKVLGWDSTRKKALKLTFVGKNLEEEGAGSVRLEFLMKFPCEALWRKILLHVQYVRGALKSWKFR